MLDLRVGFLGAGNMARAIAGGLVRAGLVRPEDIVASDVVPEALAGFAAAVPGAVACQGNVELVQSANVVVFATKPYHVGDVCDEIRAAVSESKLVVSICAGVPTSLFEARVGDGVRVVRVMPNTPALVGLGSTAVSGGRWATADDVALVVRMFEGVGVAVAVDESLLDVVTGLSGSGPAYFFRFAEHLIEAGVELGLDEPTATILVRQLMHGAGKMGGESPMTLAALRQMVTTKGGTTEAGLRQLEEGDLSELVLDCVRAATRRSEEFSRG